MCRSSSCGWYSQWLVVGAQTHCSLVHFLRDLRAANLCFTSSTWGIAPRKQPKIFVAWKVKVHLITRWFKKLSLGCKNLDNQARSSRHKSDDFEAVPRVIEVNPVSSTRRVSGELRHFIIQRGSSSSWVRQKHPELPNCSERYQNIA